MIESCGGYNSKKGVRYLYSVSDNGYVESWVNLPPKRITGGWKLGDQRYVKPTKELLNYISGKYNIKAWTY